MVATGLVYHILGIYYHFRSSDEDFNEEIEKILNMSAYDKIEHAKKAEIVNNIYITMKGGQED